MTCIAAVTHAETRSMWIGGDAALTDEYFAQFTMAAPKVWEVGDMLLGVSGSARLMDILRYSFKVPTDNGDDPAKYLATKFVDELRLLTKKKGMMHKEEAEEVPAHVLICYRGRIFAIYEDWQVSEHAEPFLAIGSGAQEALASLYSTQYTMDPDERIEIALKAACRYNATCREPITIISMAY